MGFASLRASRSRSLTSGDGGGVQSLGMQKSAQEAPRLASRTASFQMDTSEAAAVHDGLASRDSFSSAAGGLGSQDGEAQQASRVSRSMSLASNLSGDAPAAPNASPSRSPPRSRHPSAPVSARYEYQPPPLHPAPH
jgi:hypothetical protein